MMTHEVFPALRGVDNINSIILYRFIVRHYMFPFISCMGANANIEQLEHPRVYVQKYAVWKGASSLRIEHSLLNRSYVNGFGVH